MSPNFFMLLGVISGILAASHGELHPLIWLGSGSALAVWVWFGRMNQRRCFGLWLMAALMLLAGFEFDLLRQDYLRQVISNHKYLGRRVTVRGYVTDRPVETDRGIRLGMQAEPAPWGGPKGRITVYYSREIPNLFLGTPVQVSGVWKNAKTGCRGVPDFYEQRRITGSISANWIVRRAVGIGRYPWLYYADKLRARMTEVARHSFLPVNRRLFEAIIFGIRLNEEGETGQIQEELRDTGTIHLLSVSGTHICLVAAALFWLLTRLGFGKTGRSLMVLLGVWVYIMMTGMEAPTLRAGLMLLIGMAGRGLGVRDDNLNRLSLAGLVLLVLNPYNLYDIGFQLSFVATAGVIWLYPILKEYFSVQWRYFQPAWEAFLLSAAAQVMVLPVLEVYFNQISWVGPWANLTAALPAAFIVPAGLAGECIGLLVPSLGALILRGVDGLISLLRITNHFWAGQWWAVSYFPSWPWPWLVGYYLALFCFLEWSRPNLFTQKRNSIALVIALLLFCNIAVWTEAVRRMSVPCLEAVFLDVGQGDAILLVTPHRTAALIDGGEDGRGRKVVAPYLRQHGIASLRYILVTHGHSDHTGGVDEVLTRIATKTVLFPSPMNTLTRDLWRTTRQLQVEERVAYRGMRLYLDRDICVETFRAGNSQNENDNSTVTIIKYGKSRLLLTGDLTAKGEKILLDAYPYLGKMSILKVGHHGSNASSSGVLLRQIRPKLAVICVGAGNRYGHPGQNTLQRLRTCGSDIYRTDQHGTIRIKVYPDKFEVLSQR